MRDEAVIDRFLSARGDQLERVGPLVVVVQHDARRAQHLGNGVHVPVQEVVHPVALDEGLRQATRQLEMGGIRHAAAL